MEKNLNDQKGEVEKRIKIKEKVIEDLKKVIKFHPELSGILTRLNNELKLLLAQRVRIYQDIDKKAIEEIEEINESELNKYKTYRELIKTKSRQMIKVFDIIDKVADSNATVLIYGESGSGKELVARAIHLKSSRRECPFITLDCGKYQGDLLKSELFGHEKGAFTGAISQEKGRIELANGGTLFLDEINNTSPSLQENLLTFVQHKTFQRVGGKEDLTVDVRIICATNVDLKEKIQEGSFREDLYRRINVIQIKLPSLRERKIDIPLLTEHFLNKMDNKEKRGMKQMDDLTLNYLINYNWPGNVRELESVVERCYLLTEGSTIRKESLPDEIISFDEKKDIFKQKRRNKQIVERKLIVDALNQTEGHRGKTYKMLVENGKFNLSYQTFCKLINEKYKIKKEEYSR